jgi:hypothetical protein
MDQSENTVDSFLVRLNSIYPSVGLTLGPLFFTIPLVAGIILSRPIPYNPYFKSPVLISVIRVDKWVVLPCKKGNYQTRIAIAEGLVFKLKNKKQERPRFYPPCFQIDPIK